MSYLMFVITACLLFGYAVSEEKPKKLTLPTVTVFLERLFNVTALEVIQIAKSFDFDEIISGQIYFLWYHPNGSYYSYEGDIKKRMPNVDPSEPIKFIVHGWQATGTDDWVKKMAKAYHSIGVKNVIAVDWSSHSKKNYMHSASSTKKVGEILADFILNLVKDVGQLANVHVVGHSLGAHVSSFAGKHVKNVTMGGMISRITGLDAAAPLFEFPIPLPEFLRLARGDAEFVDSFHTNAGFMGCLGDFADADFYVEYGGPIQPGCTREANIFEAFVCSHGKSHDIFVKTITSKEYKATSCPGVILAVSGLCMTNSKVSMGEHVPRRAEGEYYVRVNEQDRPKADRPNAAAKAIVDTLPGLQRFG